MASISPNRMNWKA